MSSHGPIATVLPTASAGAAFVLQDRPPSAAVIPIGQGNTAELDPGSPYLVIRCKEFASEDDAEISAHRLAQQALDLYAARGLGSLTTRRAALEFVLWWQSEGQTHLRFVDTVLTSWHDEFTFDMGDGRPVPPIQFPTHHPSFRFFRLSQLTDDLFDSYRNAYLALELLVSELVPKRKKESEPVWLRRAFSGILADSVPNGRPVPALVDTLYKDARLPLFHAKDKRPHLLPQDSPVDRERIRHSLNLGLQIVMNLFKRVSQHTHPGGSWMSQEMRYAGVCAAFTPNMLRIGSGEAAISVSSPTTAVSMDRLRFDNPTLLLSCPVSSLPGLAAVGELSLLKDGEEWIALELRQAFSLASITQFEVFLQAHWCNTREPKAVFPR
jgi:hypothetical protein